MVFATGFEATGGVKGKKDLSFVISFVAYILSLSGVGVR